MESGKLAEALSKAQAEFPPIPKDRVANIGQYKYKYTDLSTILDLVRPVLAKHGLAISSAPTVTAELFTLNTVLMHSGGETLHASYPLPGGVKAQEIGSAITYGRRYSICSLLGICADEDEDGKAATDAVGKKKPPQKAPQKPKAAPQQPVEAQQDADAVPPEITDAGGDSEPYVVPEENEEDSAPPVELPQDAVGILAVVKAYSKEGKATANGGQMFGVCLDITDKTPEAQAIVAKLRPAPRGGYWLNTFSDTVWADAKAMKGKRCVAACTVKGRYVNLVNLAEVRR